MARLLLLASVVIMIGFGVGAWGEEAAAPPMLVEVATVARRGEQFDPAHERFRERSQIVLTRHGAFLAGHRTARDENDHKANRRVYLFAFPDADAARKSGPALRDDPEWGRVRDACRKEGLAVESPTTTSFDVYKAGEAKDPKRAGLPARKKPDPSRHEILLLQLSSRAYQIVERTEVPDRVYLKKSATKEEYQQYATDGDGRLGDPPKMLLSGTVLSGSWLGAPKENRYMLSKDGMWRQTNANEMMAMRSDDETGIKSTSFSPGKRVSWDELEESGAIFIHNKNK